ncbi:MAG: iron-containing alcohol dehydrogenase [Lachnospiraceae bacterium]|nr:iron-containing alcohol dehydrogenase [Lachnospiraceae bacterium]
MNNFNFCVPTDIRFGKGQIECLPEELAKYGKKILLVYGGGSIKRTGLYDTLMSLLKDFDIFELSGIEPNPKLSSVEKGAEICKKEGVDVIVQADDRNEAIITAEFDLDELVKERREWGVFRDRRPEMYNILLTHGRK